MNLFTIIILMKPARAYTARAFFMFKKFTVKPVRSRLALLEKASNDPSTDQFKGRGRPVYRA